MKIDRSLSSLVVAASVALATLGMVGSAQAQDVFWSLGLSSPGVRVGVSNALPMVVRPTYQPVYQPVYQESYPVYAAPQPVVYMRPSPVYMAQPQYIEADWRYRGHRRGWQREQRRHELERRNHDHHDNRR